ncbi:hypothetical protein B0A69_00180 [Chryseobacterium shigense]|uniref:Antitoxin component YwqK of the YwqJK toxin-antitoxin module n=1 Tax=Chryseobacterium shigense TaxID=297244 RepID=A0A1N7I0G1_9FLAO|nr:hypothetical protein [Chryseobacterium shigense]PQA97792.1 hypothetical protein B0A69_00180 [Chryseobacterium shigense]SIS30508.1 hypothetical protein SAMN05421639_101940 [Chryseobacterium shigense]
MKLTLYIFSLFATTVCVKAQTNIRQSDLKDFSIGKEMEKHQPQNVKYKDGKALSPGKYIVLMDEEGRNSEGLKSLFEINQSGKINGEMNFELPGNPLDVKAVYQDDILVKIDKKQNGKLIETSYFDQGIFYEKEFDENGDFKSESRSKDGKVVYSKRMNLSGWDVQDETEGTRTFYYGKTNTVESRTRSKNLEKGATWMEEKYNEKGHLVTKEIRYGNNKRKVINADGSYEMIISTNSGDKVSEYSSKGKLLKTYTDAYPTMPSL